MYRQSQVSTLMSDYFYVETSRLSLVYFHFFMVKSSTLPIETIKKKMSLRAGPDNIKIQSLRQMGNSEEVRDRGKEEGREGRR